MILVVAFNPDAQIFVAAQINIVIRRIAVVIDIQILFGQIDIGDCLGLLLDFWGDLAPVFKLKSSVSLDQGVDDSEPNLDNLGRTLGKKVIRIMRV